MQVEASFIEQSMNSDATLRAKHGTLRAELRAWGRLFEPKLLRRTLIGVVMMAFQRAFSFTLPFTLLPLFRSIPVSFARLALLSLIWP